MDQKHTNLEGCDCLDCCPDGCDCGEACSCEETCAGSDCSCGEDCCCGEEGKTPAEKMDDLKDKATEVANQAVDYAKELKNKYEQADPATKNKIKKGALGGLTVLVGLIGLKKIFGRKK